MNKAAKMGDVTSANPAVRRQLLDADAGLPNLCKNIHQSRLYANRQSARQLSQSNQRNYSSALANQNTPR